MSPDTGTEMVLLHDLDGHRVGQRRADGYLNASALCKAAGKLWADYRRLDGSERYLTELEAVMGIPITELVQVRQGGRPDEQGTWVHPNVAVHLAQWCSARFAVQVGIWINELVTRGRVELVPESGDAFLDSVVLLQRATTALVETRRRQLELEQAQAETRALADQANRRATAALDQARNNHGRMQVLGFGRLIGLELTEAQASAHGRALSQLCRERGITIERHCHERYGFVNVYPLTILREYFEVVDDAGTLAPVG